MLNKHEHRGFCVNLKHVVFRGACQQLCLSCEEIILTTPEHLLHTKCVLLYIANLMLRLLLCLSVFSYLNWEFVTELL